MTMNLVVPSGMVRFVFYDMVSDAFREERIGAALYARITVPPKIWFGFKGLGDKTNLLVNIANMPHDDNEVETKDIDKFEFI